MVSRIFAASLLLAACVSVNAEAQPKYAMKAYNELARVMRRQEGYSPTQTYCSSGETCTEACGAGYETCFSSDDILHCYEPSEGEICCPDGSGNSCDAGYYCTLDSDAETWCCPSDLDTSACAASYGLSVLFSQASAAATSTDGAATLPTAIATTTTSGGGSRAPTAVETASAKQPTSSASASSKVSGSAAAGTTSARTTSGATPAASTVAQFTGAAAHHDAMGLPIVVLGAAGVLAAL